MPELKLHKPSPYTQERAEQLHRKYLQLNSAGLALMSAGHVALGVVYNDVLMTLFFGLFVIIGIGYRYLFGNLSHNTYVVIGEVLIVSGVIGTQMVFPKGAASAVLLFPLGVTLLAFSQTIVRGASVLVLALILYFSFSMLDLYSSTEQVVPEILSYCITLFYCGVVLVFQLNKARKSVEFAVRNMVETESELSIKEDDLKRYQTKLTLLNEELDEENKTLLNTLEKESLTSRALEVERSSQEELTKAIHRDLRDPLRSIVSASEELGQRFELIPAAKPVASYLGFAADGAKRMTKMLDDLLEYTKGDTTQAIAKVDLNEVIESLQQDLSDLIERSGAEVESSTMPIINGFPTQLTQLFQNLLSNALKFSRPGVAPKVSIYPADVQDREGYFMIRVRDNGVGIPANQIDSVFGLFNRAHVQDGYEGSGVGLALCRRIAVAHDALLTVVSVYGEGTQFTIAFPISSVVNQPERLIERSRFVAEKNIETI